MRQGSGVLAAAAVLGVAACSSGPALVERAPQAPAAFNARALLALSDVDMPGTAYADGILAPIAGAKDALQSIAPDALTTRGPEVGASNSVMAWPGSLDVSPDGRFAYVLELRGPPPAGAEKLDSVYTQMPEGKTLTAVSIEDPRAPRVIGQIDLPAAPTAIHVSPDQRFALVSLKNNATPLAIVTLNDGLPTAVLPLAIALGAQAQREIDHGALFVRLAPNGRDFVLNVANTHVQFGRVTFDAEGVATGVESVGEAVRVGQWLTIARWSGDGRHALVADVAWSSDQLGAALNGPGAIVSIAFDAQGAHRIVSTAPVSLSPEAFEMNRAGDLLVAVNMERTYLPERLPFTLFGRREQNSLSLVAFDAASGALKTIDGPVAFGGVLPEDAVFDADGDMLAVAVFHEKSPTPKAGWVEYFRIDRSAGAPRVIPTGVRTPTARGAHDLAVVW